MEFRQIFKDNKTLMYKLKINQKTRNITAKINKNNIIEVIAPEYLSHQEIDAFVLKYFDRFFEYINKRNEQSLINLSENKISLKGLHYEIKINIIESGKEKYEIINNKIYLFLKEEEHKQKLINKLLNDLGNKYLIERTKKIAKKFHFNVSDVLTKWYDSKWGQCDVKNKKITLAIQLYIFNDEIIDYVIIHELCHLIYPNHSKEFWLKVQELYPNYLLAKEKLKFQC